MEIAGFGIEAAYILYFFARCHAKSGDSSILFVHVNGHAGTSQIVGTVNASQGKFQLRFYKETIVFLKSLAYFTTNAIAPGMVIRGIGVGGSSGRNVIVVQ